VKLCIALSLLFMANSPLSLAWGPEGHRVVASVAESRLTPAAKLHVRELLGNDDLAAISIWADEVRRDRPETFGWHFVDIPMSAAGFNEQRDCYRPDRKHPDTLQDHHNCVVDRITIFSQALADRNASGSARVEALKFLVHFVGDIHQPMHEVGEARGGNDIRVLPLNSSDCGDRACNLHALWDFGLIAHDMHAARQRAPSDFSASINNLIIRNHLQSRAGGTPEQWANESFQLAKQAWLNDGASVTREYYRKNTRIMEDQLGLAGLRLATMLNQLFGR
jgi:nuclease S1